MDRVRSRDEERDKHKESFMHRFFNTFSLPLIAFIVIVITVAMVIIILLVYQAKTQLPSPEKDRIECPGLNETSCFALGCYWQKVRKGPSCYMIKDSFGYKVDEVMKKDNGVEIKLSSLTPNTPYGGAIRSIIFKMTYVFKDIVRFQFTDEESSRYEVIAQSEFPLLKNPVNVTNESITYVVDYTKKDVFHFQIKRNTGTILWDTRIGGLVLSEQYLQIASYLPSSNIYGLGEHVHDTLRHKMDFISWPMFARDRFPSSHANHQNLYGVHPFYTCLENDGKSHGVLFLNSNAMEATLMPAPAISFRTIGGILDFFIFIGDTPEAVTQLYTSLVGRPMMPPYWSLGFQLSRYGYDDIEKIKALLNRTRAARIPQDVQYLDIDHMEENKDFTYDEELFPSLPEFMEEQRNDYQLKWITILDPAIGTVKDYKPWTSGRDKNVFVKRSKRLSKFLVEDDLDQYDFVMGKVWPPTYAAFPDFFMEETKTWWKEHIIEHRKNISFDGLWIDMNEPANFETNVEKPSFCKEVGFNESGCTGLMCPEGPYEDPPYNPLQNITGDRLSEKTICMESKHKINATEYRHYDVHSLYGWSQTEPTLMAAQEATGTRSLVISRSTYPSSGRYAGHWLGDNTSNFPNMKNSIIGMLEFNLFGIPYVGADVCGFVGTASAHLCKRWMQLGAFYPFFRNHNSKENPDQDPAFFGSDVAEASRKAVERRIAFNPYLYTLFYRAHVYGNTVVRPVFHEFPLDKETWDMDKEFMWGKSMLITPILEENRKSLYIYLPKGEWWHFLFDKTKKEKHSERYMIATDADEYTPVFIRGGTILPVANYKWDSYPEKENDTRKMDLYVFPESGVASGELFMDDGVSIDTIKNNTFALYKFTLEKNTCKLKIESDEKAGFKGVYAHLEKIHIYKVKTAIKAGNFTVSFDNKLNVLTVTVGKQMGNLEVTWEDDKGTCSMLT